MRLGVSIDRCPHSAKRKLLHLILLFLFAPVSILAQTWKWTTEKIDTAGVQTSIVVDKDNNVHLSYFAGGVKYGFRAADSSKWFTMMLAPVGGYAEVPTRVTLDAAQNPHICFTPGSFKYASFEKHGWNIQQIDPQSGLIEFTCSVAIAADGTPHATWYQENLLHLKYAVLQNGTWIARILDSDSQTGKWNSMMLDAQGNPHICYTVYGKGELKYAYWDGKDWHRTIIDSPEISPEGPSGGMGNSLALNHDGKAEISYENEATLKFAREQDDGWKRETVDTVVLSGSWRGFRTRLALDPQGNPHIAYESSGAVKHAYWDGSTWRIQVISPAGPEQHRYEDIAIDREGTIYIVYQDATDNSLMASVGRLQSQPLATENEKKPQR